VIVRQSPVILFTDLDGTLLDEQTYSAAAAAEALDEIERRRVPVVFCTSKTRAEVEVLRRKLGNAHPFITENGGGIFIPQGYFSMALPRATAAGRYHCIALARPYQEIADELDQLAADTGTTVVGFHHMSANEVARNTGLPVNEAKLARMREFDEPFFFAGANERAERAFAEQASRRGLQLVRGGRFWHLFSGSDKGRAVRELMRLYRTAWRTRVRAIAIGNSDNDLSMLAVADLAILLPERDGELNPDVVSRLPTVHRGTAPGPAGWNQAILELLREPSKRAKSGLPTR
jgi:mannosyl-3-phosphoglycerate phosphatase